MYRNSKTPLSWTLIRDSWLTQIILFGPIETQEAYLDSIGEYLTVFLIISCFCMFAAYEEILFPFLTPCSSEITRQQQSVLE